ncbi:MAG: AAA family ATPase, partial [Eubacteriales bacterium]
EDKRSSFIVILAGYRKEMENLMKTNPGLQSRFTKFIEFQDYTEEELLEIAIMIAKDQHYELSEDGKRAFKQTIRRLMVDEKFGNARAVRNVMNDAFEEKANNFDMDSNDDFTVITAREFTLADGNGEENLQKYLLELHSLTGLESVKNDITHLIERMEYEREEEDRTGRRNAPMDMHMVFTGNPGTGKTTVARMYGDLLREIGVLKKGHFKEVSRANLVGKYQGHTAQKVQEVCEDAYGGILFIDEAYSLCTGEMDSFGKEAVDTLIKEMEDNKDKLLVILAGYTNEMSSFLLTNPGFASRISQTILFHDYTALELLEIFKLYMEKENIEMDSVCDPILYELFAKMLRNSTRNFGNARDVRKLFNDIKRNMISRVQREDVEGDDRRKILSRDIEMIEKEGILL